jgi:hypothetical protein
MLNFFGLRSERDSDPTSLVNNTNFVAMDYSSMMKFDRSPWERIRSIDSLRLHLPTKTERSNLQLPAFLERIDVTEASKYLMMFGGNNGVTFSVEVISFLLPHHSTYYIRKWQPFERICKILIN